VEYLIQGFGKKQFMYHVIATALTTGTIVGFELLIIIFDRRLAKKKLAIPKR